MPLWLQIILGVFLAFAMGAFSGWITTHREEKEHRRKMQALIDSWESKRHE